MRKQTKIAAMVSAAALLAIGASVTSLAAGKWDNSTGVWQYLDQDGDPEEGWHRHHLDGQMYYADEDGYMVGGHLIGEGGVDDLSGKVYYVNADGQRVKEMWIPTVNEDGETFGSVTKTGDEDVSPETLYHYIGSGYIADKAADVGYKAFAGVYKNTSGPNAYKYTGRFLFDENGYMATGWVTIGTDEYYCVTLDDLYDNVIQVGPNDQMVADGENPYVEGEALNGWAKFPDPDDPDAEGTWYYFKSGKLVKDSNQYLSWNGASAYYSFDPTTGALLTESQDKTKATYADANGKDQPAVVAVYIDGTNGVADVNSWKLDSDDNYHYIVNLRDSAHKVTRGVVFNSNSTGYAAKVIDGETYIFDEDGIMQEGRVELEAATIASWNGITCKVLPAGVYYCCETTGHRGELMKGKITYVYGDEEVISYFGTDGRLLKNVMVDGYVYDQNGFLYTATDEKYDIYTVADTTPAFRILKGKNLVAQTTTLTKGDKIIVSQTGKALQNKGSVYVDGIEYSVTNYEAGIPE